MREGTQTYLGSVCKRNHDGVRYVKTGHCVQCNSMTHKVMYENNKEFYIEKTREYNQANKERVAEWHKKRKKEHYQNNKEAYLSYVHARRSRIAKNGGSYKVKDIQALFETQRGLCNLCSCHLESFEIDHIVPISKGGTSYPKNLQLLCRPCNRKKGNK